MFGIPFLKRYASNPFIWERLRNRFKQEKRYAIVKYYPPSYIKLCITLNTRTLLTFD